MPIPKWKDITSDPRWNEKTDEQKTSIREQWLNDVAAENPEWGNKEIAELRTKTSLITESMPTSEIKKPASAISPSEVGAIAGGMAFEALGTPFLAMPFAGPFARAGMAGIGGMVGSQLGQGIESGGVPPIYAGGMEYVGGQMPEQPPNWERTKGAGISQATGSLAGHGLTKVVSKTVSPLAHKMYEDAQEIIPWMQEYGGEPFGALISKGKWQQLKHTIAEAGDPAVMQEFAEQKIWKPIKKGFTVARAKIGDYLEPSARGRLGQSSLKGAERMFHDKATPLYAKVDEIWKEPIVSTKPIKEWAQSIIDDKTIMGSNSLREKAEQFLELPDRITFGRAHAERSASIGLSRSMKESMNRPDEAKVKSLVSILNSTMDEAGQNMQSVTTFQDPLMKVTKQVDPTKAYQAYREAADFYKTGATIYDSDYVSALIENPDMAKVGLQFIGKNPENVDLLKQALYDNSWSPKEYKQAYDTIRASFLEDVILKEHLTEPGEELAKRGLEKEIIPLKYTQILKRLDDYGETYNKLYSPEEKSNIAKGLRVLQALSRQEKRGKSGKILVDIKTAGAYGAMAGTGYQIAQGDWGEAGYFATGGGFVLLAPTVFAKMISNKAYNAALRNTVSLSFENQLRTISQIAAKAALGTQIDEKFTKKPQSNIKFTTDYIPPIPSNF